MRTRSRGLSHLAGIALIRGVLTCGVVCAVGCATRKAAQPEDLVESTVSPADKHFDVAVGSFHNGMFADATLQLERALRADPEHADSYYLKGLLLLNEARTLVDAVETQQCLTDAASDLQRDRARQLHTQARDAFSAAVEHYPEGAAGRGRAINSLAVISLFFHDHEAAIEQSTSALDQDFYADRYSALTNLGWAHYNLGDLVSATNELRQAVLLNPDFCVARYRLAQVYLETNLIAQAAEQARMVVDDPRCPIQDAHRILGAARIRLDQPDAAQEAFGQCVALAPRSCLARDCHRFLASSANGAMLSASP